MLSMIQKVSVSVSLCRHEIEKDTTLVVCLATWNVSVTSVALPRTVICGTGVHEVLSEHDCIPRFEKKRLCGDVAGQPPALRLGKVPVRARVKMELRVSGVVYNGHCGRVFRHVGRRENIDVVSLTIAVPKAAEHQRADDVFVRRIKNLPEGVLRDRPE